MATVIWLGKAPAVAQVGTFQVTAYDAATTYRLLVNGNSVSTIAAGSVNATATALASAWNASADPYFTGITASAATDTVTLTADVAGLPFTATSSETGGTGTIGDYVATTASSGPNDWSTAANWSGGAVPVSTDTAYIKDSAVNIVHGLAQSAVTLAALIIEKSFTGKIGLNRAVLATSADGESTDTTRTEYRATYLAISATNVRIGELSGTVDANGSSRILLDLGSNASTVQIYGNNATPSESGRPGIRLKAAHASTSIFVYSAPGGVGVAVDTPGETSTISTINVADTSTSTKVFLGNGVTITTWVQNGGANIIRAAATVTTVTINGGTLLAEGDFIITTANAYGGTLTASQINSGSGGAITTLNINGGTVDGQKSNRARTWTTVNLTKGVLKSSGTNVAITTLNTPTSGNFSLTAE